jgi:hypothetical protein
MNEQELREAIEACRPNGDDLRLPEMSALAEALAHDPRWQAVFARTQRCDAAIGQAFGDVPIPAGLCERLLASVAQPVPAEPTEVAAVSKVPTVVLTDRPGPASARRSLFRSWRIRAIALATVAAALTLFLVFRGTPGRLPELNDDFSREVIGWTEQVQQGDWSEKLAAAHPLDPAIRAVPRRWTQLATGYDRRTLVYDLTPPGRDFAFAFCIPVRGRPCVLPSLPPAMPFSTTGGVAMGAWQAQDMVYVLAVQGGQNRYQTFMNSGILIGLGRGPVPPACLVRSI